MTRCLVCDSVDQWQNVDEFKIKPTQMSMCKNCGFVTHLSNLKSAEELKEFYRKDYRQAPTAQNYFSGERKIHYHRKFLGETLVELSKDKGKGVAVTEVGSAYGLFLKWVKSGLPEADISGTELTETFRKIAYYENEIKLSEEFDYSKQYDLICSYKVAEHIPDIDIELRKQVLCLKPGGKYYISVPIWFKQLNNFGAGGFDIEYYYHTNHINVWTQKTFETLLKKVGLKVIKFDDKIYDNTYLCERDDSLMAVAPEYETPEYILGMLKTVKAVSDAMIMRDPETALRLYKNFPLGHTVFLEKNRTQFNGYIQQHGFDKFNKDTLEKIIEWCDNTPDAYVIAADWSMRYDAWDLAVKYLDIAWDLRPGSSGILINRAHCFARMAKKLQGKNAIDAMLESIGTLKELRRISTQDFEQATTWIYKYQAELPLYKEG